MTVSDVAPQLPDHRICTFFFVSYTWHRGVRLQDTSSTSVVPATPCVAQGYRFASGESVHIGRRFDLCVERHSELPPEQRKYKGRVIFQGKNVQDESGLSAVFADQGSSVSFISMSSLMAGTTGWERYPADAEFAAAEPDEEDAAVEDGFSFLTGAGC